MSQSGIASYVITFNYPQSSLADITRLNNQLMLEGFATTIADADGIPHELGPNNYAVTSPYDKNDIAKLARALGETALGFEPDVEVMLRDDYFSRRRAQR